MESRVIRIKQDVVKELSVLIVVRCGKVFKWRFRLAVAIMRIAGKIGGFKAVRVVRELER